MLFSRMENKPKKAKTKKKKVLSGSVLSSWYCHARPDPAGLRRQSCSETCTKRETGVRCSIPKLHPGPSTPHQQHRSHPQGHGGLWLFLPPSSGVRKAAEGFIQNSLQKAQGWWDRTLWARYCNTGQGGDGSNASLNHYSSVTLQTFFLLIKS